MSLATASRRIALLEHRFKTTLFDRTSRGIGPTPAGAALVEHAKSLMIQVNKMQSEMTAFESGTKGSLRIVASTSVLTHGFPAGLARFLRMYPDYQVSVTEMWSRDIVTSLLSAQADVGFLIAGISVEGLTTCTYGFDRICVIFPKTHPLNELPSIKLVDVLDYEIVGLERSANMMQLVAMEAAKIEKPFRVRIEVKGFEAVIKLCKAGLGVGLLPSAVGEPIELPGNDLVGRPIEEEWAVREILMCIRKDVPTSSALSKFLEVFKATDASRFGIEQQQENNLVHGNA